MILSFSGNGNSHAVAHWISDALPATVMTVEPSRGCGAWLEHEQVVKLRGELINAAEPVLEVNDRRLVWVMPVYSWGIPPVVADFMRRVKVRGDNVLHHLVLTCGDDAGFADRQWRRLIRSRGWQPGTASTVIMPNTYVLMKGFDVDSPKVEKRKISEAIMVCHRIADVIESGRKGRVKRGWFPLTKTYIINPWFRRHAMSPEPFHCTDDCIGCGSCASRCPMCNITMVDGHPHWGDNCALCLGCYNCCPTHSVAYGKVTRGKGQYIFGKKSC